ncbi:peptidase [Aliidiomarina minuta]|uniref:Peptidase n=1 Tax=Aliidiomarina minuta TaxID=880057 RepID=A0A432W9T6_9GAMM|nr:prolyl oligopeptidase family serine peptidase [Aliidiomarina minuta]RUO26869.1 peptidase [Aliidiomarina minuta]
MLKNVCLFFLTLFSFAFGVGEAAEDESNQLLSADTCFRSPFGSYSEWVSMITASTSQRLDDEAEIQERVDNFRSQFPEEDFEHYRQTLDCQTFRYHSGDALVNGYVIRPKDADSELPVIIYNRGGNGNYGSVNMARMAGDLFPLAEEGFIVIGTQYRGTFEREPEYHDEFGGADVEDVTRLLELLPEIPNADMDRIGMLGTSRGAMQSYLALKDSSQVKALVTIAGNVDLLKDLETRPEMERVYEGRIPNYDTNKEDELRKRSAIHWISEINSDIPILLLHGEEDERVNARNSVAMAEELARLGREYKFVLYSNDGHDLSENKEVAFHEVIKWFDTHLQ